MDSSLSVDDRPDRLSRDRAFWGMTLTQFLGAFNDNLFKQLVLLICVDVKRLNGVDYQSYAQAIFAVPFVLLSGFAGYLADRYSKRAIVVLAKVAEIGIMLMGMLVFLYQPGDARLLLISLFVVLGFMSIQSAFFGPSKYGILPELFRNSDLPAVNGTVQMTTFVAIILGMALAGIGKELLGGDVWVMSGVCVLIGIVGTGTSLLVRRTPVAQPGLPFEPSVLALHGSIVQLLKRDRVLRGVLLVSSLFWFLGGVVQVGVNELGKSRIGLGDGRTSVMLAWMASGIAAGCVAAARMSHHRIDFRLVTWGSWGIVAALTATWILSLTAPVPPPVADGAPNAPIESIWQMVLTAAPREWALRAALTAVGFFGGLFIVPLQVFMQARPPEQLKGRMIGSMNLVNWIGIVGSALFFGIAMQILTGWQRAEGLSYPPVSWLFAALALLLAPVALFYRPRADDGEAHSGGSDGT